MEAEEIKISVAAGLHSAALILSLLFHSCASLPIQCRTHFNLILSLFYPGFRDTFSTLGGLEGWGRGWGGWRWKAEIYVRIQTCQEHRGKNK